jgi:hypothetical protein
MNNLFDSTGTAQKINADGRSMTLIFERERALADRTKSHSYHGEATFFISEWGQTCILIFHDQVA